MDLTFSAEQEAFRAEARAWLEAHVPADPLPSLDTAEGFEAHRAWERTMFEDRWSVVSWPTEYGGRDGRVFEWVLLSGGGLPRRGPPPGGPERHSLPGPPHPPGTAPG